MSDLSSIVELVFKVKDEGTAVLKKVSSELKTIKSSTDKASKSTKGFSASEGRAQAGAKKYEYGLSRLIAKFKKLRSETTKAKRDSESFLGSIQKITTGFAQVAATGSVLVVPTIKSAEFERSMAEVRAVIGDITDNEFQKMIDKAEELGAKTEFTAKQAAGGLKYLAMAGLDASQSMQALPSVLNLAQAGSMEVAQAADIATNILTGMNMPVSELGRAMDVLTATFQNSNSSLEELGYAMSYVAPIAAGLDMSIEDVTTSLGMLHNAGIKGSMAGTTLRGILTRLVSPTKQVSEKLQELGQRIGQSSIQTKDAQGNFIGMRKLLEQLKESGASASDIMELLGQRAGPGLQALLSQGIEGWDKLNNKVVNSAGTLEKSSKRMHDNLTGDWKAMLSAMEGRLIEFGNALKPVVRAFVQGFTSILTFVGEVNDEFPNLSQAVYVVAGAFTALGLAVATIKMTSGLLALTGFKWGTMATQVAAYTKSVWALEAATATAGGTLLTVLGAVGAALAVFASVYYLTKWVRGWVDGSEKVEASLRKVRDAARETQEQFKKFEDVKFKSREDLLWMDDSKLEDYKKQLEGFIQYWTAKQQELTAVSNERSFWTDAKTEEAKKAVEDLKVVNEKLAEFEAAMNSFVDVKFNGPTDLDVSIKLSKESFDELNIYKEKLHSIPDEYKSLEKEADEAYRKVVWSAEASVEDQGNAVHSLFDTYRQVFASISGTTGKTISDLAGRLNKALSLKVIDSSSVTKLTAALREGARAGAEAYQSMRDRVTSVLTDIASREEDLLSKIRGYVDEIIAINQKASDALRAIDQENMSSSQRYYDDQKLAEEELAKAAELRRQAEKASGEERKRLIDQSNKSLERAFQLTERLQQTEDGVIDKAQSQADRRKLILQYQEQATKNVELLKSAAQGEFEALEKVKNQVQGVKDIFDQLIKALNDTATLDLDTEGAIQKLNDLVGKVNELGVFLSLGLDVPSSEDLVKPVESVQQSVKKVGDTWVNVWDSAKSTADSAISEIQSKLDGKETEFAINFTGSGSATLPISEKIEAIKSSLETIGVDTSIVVDADFSKVSDGVVSVLESIASIQKEVEAVQADLESLTSISYKVVLSVDADIDTISKLKATLTDLGNRAVVTEVVVDVDSEGVDKLEGVLEELVRKEWVTRVIIRVDDEDTLERVKELVESFEDIDVQVDVKVRGLDDVTGLKKILDSLDDVTVHVRALVKGTSAVESLRKEINRLHDKTVHITTVSKTVGGASKYADGGSVFRRLVSPFVSSGSGTKDDVPALLMRGEFVHPVDVVRYYGRDAMEWLRKKKIPKDFFKAAMSPVRFATGGYVDRLRERLRKTMYGAGMFGVSAPIKGVSSTFMKQVSPVTDVGRAAVHSLANLFSDAVSRLAVGGSPGNLSQAGKNLDAKYQEEILKAKANAHIEKERILRKEREDIARLVAELNKTLQGLKIDYQQAVNERRATSVDKLSSLKEQYLKDVEEENRDYNSAVTDDTAEYKERKSDYVKSLSEFKKEYESGLLEARKEAKDTKTKVVNDLIEKIKEAQAVEESLYNYYNQASFKAWDNQNKEWISPDTYYYHLTDAKYIRPRSGDVNYKDVVALYRRLSMMDGKYGHYSKATAKGVISAVQALGEKKRELKDYIFSHADILDGGVGKLIQNARKRTLWRKIIDGSIDPQPMADKYASKLYESKKRELEAEYSQKVSEKKVEFARFAQDYALRVKTRDEDHNIRLRELSTSYTSEVEAEKVDVSKSLKDLAEGYKQNVAAIKEEYQSKIDTKKERAKSEIESLKRDVENTIQGLSGKKESVNLTLNDVQATIGRGVSKALSEGKSVTSNAEVEVANAVGNILSVVKNSKGVKTYNQALRELLKILGRGILHFNTGGIVPMLAGAVAGKDSVLASLTPDEAVVKAPVVRALGKQFFETLNALSSVDIMKLASGGLVEPVQLTATGGSEGVVHKLVFDFGHKESEPLVGSKFGIDEIIRELEFAKRRG